MLVYKLAQKLGYVHFATFGNSFCLGLLLFGTAQLYDTLALAFCGTGFLFRLRSDRGGGMIEFCEFFSHNTLSYEISAWCLKVGFDNKAIYSLIACAAETNVVL